MKKKLSFFLALLLIFTAAFSLQAAAAGDEEPAPAERHNGPLTPAVSSNPFALQFTFLMLNELNEDGTAKRDEEFNGIGYVLFRNQWDEAASEWKVLQDKLPDGVAYDLATNTLTLTGFDGGKYILSANMMGDDLTIRVSGDCRLGGVTVWGDGWGAGLRIAGTGSLTVNEKKLFDSAIDFHPEGVDLTFRIDRETTVKFYAKKDAVSVYGTTQTENVFDLPDGARAEPKKETYVEKRNKRLEGYSIDAEYHMETSGVLGVSRDDPDGIYTVNEVTYYPNGIEEDGIPKVDVTHYYYSEKYDYYLEDHDFGDEQGHSERVFDDLAAAKAAGFEQVLDETGNPVWIEMKTPYGSGTCTVVIGPDGKEYGSTFTKKSEGVYGDVLAEIEPLPGVEDKYLFVVRRDLIDIDPETLEPVKIDVTYDGMYTWTIPGKELVYQGTGGQPGFMLGDVDGNKSVTAADARLALRAAVGLETYPAGTREFLAADVDLSETLTAADARLILRRAVGFTDAEWGKKA